MDAQAGMLARLFERSMGLGDEWEVSDVWSGEREGAQAIVMALSGMTVTAIAQQLHETDTRIWRLLGRAVSEARDAADYSGVVRVGIDDTARRRGQSCISIMADLDGQRAIAVTEGRDKSAVGRLCAELEEHGGDRKRIQKVTRDMAEAYSLGVAAEMPQAAQTVDRFHAMQLFTRAIDHVRCAERRKSAEKRRQLAGTKYLWLKGKASLTESQLAKREALDPAKTHLRTARACQMGEALQDACSCAGRESAAEALGRLSSWMMHSNVREMKTVAGTLRKEREGILSWWRRGSTNSFLEGLNSVVQSARSAARGFRSIAYFRTVIFLRLGRLDFTAQKKLACATH